MRRRLVFSLCAALLAGCAGLTGDTAGLDPLAGNTAVLALDHTPLVRIEGFSGGRLQGFADGMGNTFVACFQSFGQGACVNSGCGAMVLFLLGTCGTLSVVGGIAGALTTDTDSAQHAAASSIDRALSATPAQLQLRDRLIAKARRHGTTLAALEMTPQPGGGVDYAAIRGLGIDNVLEVELTRVGTAGSGDGALSQLYMEARVRHVRVADQRELGVRDYRVAGASYAPREWQANNGARLREGFQQAYEALAARIYAAQFRP